MKRSLMLSLVMVLSLGLSTEAQAVEFLFGLMGKGGGANITTSTTDTTFTPQKFDLGFGGGGQFFAMLKATPALAIGLFADVMYHTFTEAGSTTKGVDLLTPGFGIKGRLHFANGLTGGLSLGGVVGFGTDQDTESTQDITSSVAGFHASLDGAYRYQFEPYKTYLEFGAYVTYNYLTVTGIDVDGVAVPDASVPDSSINAVEFGVMLGVAFEIGQP